MINNYPKKREQLPEEYLRIYNKHYVDNRSGRTTASFLSKLMESWLHKKVAADVKKTQNKSTLEIGAGTLNQLDFEKPSIYDIVEPFKDLYKYSKHISHVRNFYNDIREVEASQKYERIISIATFEHITNLPEVVAKTCQHLNENGTLRVSIPNEGTILWKLGWKITTGIEFRIKYKLKYETLLKYEHVNKAGEVEDVLKYFYSDINCACFGISKRFAFYRFYECSKPIMKRAEEYLADCASFS